MPKLPKDLSTNNKTQLINEIQQTIDSYMNRLAKQNNVYITCILDRSGSMASTIKDAIGGFNTFLKEQQELTVDNNAMMSIHMFDNDYITHVKDTSVRDISPLTDKIYSPRGSTALNDAIGETLTELLKVDNKNNIIVILTDGEENSSKNFNTDQVKSLITKCEEKDWKFVYLAANQDAFSVAKSYGIYKGFISNYVANSEGIKSVYLTATNSVSEYRAQVDSNTYKII